MSREIGKKLITVVIAVSVALNFNCDNTTNHDPTVINDFSEYDDAYPGSEVWFNEMMKNPETGIVPPDIMQKEARFLQTMQKNENRLVKSLDEKILTWEHNGPFNIGGRTKAIAVDITNENIILAGSDAGGIWRSENGGLSWSKRTLPNQNQFIRSLAQDTRPGKTNIWYCGTYGYWSDDDSPNSGIYKSTDNGLSWNHLPPPWIGSALPSTGRTVRILKIVTNPNNLNQDELFAAVRYGNQSYLDNSLGNIIRSTDGGQTWLPVLGDNSTYFFYTDIEMAVKSNVFYAALCYDPKNRTDKNEAGLWRSVDGVNWVNITPPNWKNTYGKTEIAVAPSNENTVYFLRARGSQHDLFKYTFVSGDGSGSGGIWEDRSESINNRQGRHRFYSYSGKFLLISVKPDDENTVFIGGLQFFRSRDGFSTIDYDPIVTETFHIDQGDMVFSPTDPNTAYFSNDGGLFKSNDVLRDSMIYESLDNGYMTSQFYSVALDQSENPDKTVMIGGMQDNGVVYTGKGDPNIDWHEISGGDGIYMAIDEDRSNYYVSIQGGEVSRFKIGENGKTDHEKGRTTRIDPIQGVSKYFTQDFILNPANKNLMYYAGGNYIYRNNDLSKIPKYCQDASQYWEKLTNTYTEDRIITAMEMSVEPKHRLYYATSPLGGSIYRLDGSHIGDMKPKKLSSPVLPVTGGCNSIAVDRKDAEKVLLTIGGYETQSIFYSYDGGLTWKDVSGNLEEFPNGEGGGPVVFWAEIVNYRGHNVFFVGTSAGLFSTRELRGNSTIWIQEAPDTIGNVRITMIDSRDSDGRVSAATYANGIYSASLSEVIKDDNIIYSKDFNLKSNYPNPFNMGTTIRYELGEPAVIKVKIYSITGREVNIVDSGEKEAGPHSAQWDGLDNFGKRVASGVYIYRLTVGGKHKSGKMLLIK